MDIFLLDIDNFYNYLQFHDLLTMSQVNSKLHHRLSESIQNDPRRFYTCSCYLCELWETEPFLFIPLLDSQHGTLKKMYHYHKYYFP